MSKRQEKVFNASRPAPNENASDEAKRSALAGALNAMDVKPNGTAQGRVRDPNFDADIAQLVARSTPHIIFGSDGTPETVSIKLNTLVTEVDGEGEVMAWIYEES